MSKCEKNNGGFLNNIFGDIFGDENVAFLLFLILILLILATI